MVLNRIQTNIILMLLVLYSEITELFERKFGLNLPGTVVTKCRLLCWW